MDVEQVLVRLVRNEVEIAVLHRAASVYELGRGIVFAVGLAVYHGESFFHGEPRGDRSLTDLSRLDLFAVDISPEFVCERFDLRVRIRIILETWRSRRFGTEYKRAVFHERFNPLE